MKNHLKKSAAFLLCLTMILLNIMSAAAEEYEVSELVDESTTIVEVTEIEEVKEAYDADTSENSQEVLALGGGTKAASIGDNEYITLQDAVNAAQNGDVIILLRDESISGNSGYTIPSGLDLTLDLNGHSLSNLVTAAAGSQVITNNGKLTIVDSGNTGIIFNSADESMSGTWPSNNYVTNVISNKGELVLESGTIENKAKGNICYPVDAYPGSKTVINGGKLYNYYTSALRMFCNSTTLDTEVIVNGGTVEGYGAIYLQNPNSNCNKGTLKISGGNFKTTEKAVAEGTTEIYDGSSYMQLETGYYTTGNDNMTVDITGGIFDVNIHIYVSKTENTTGNISISGGTFNGYVYSNSTNKFITGGDYRKFEYEVDGEIYKNSDDVEYYMPDDFVLESKDDNYDTVRFVHFTLSFDAQGHGTAPDDQDVDMGEKAVEPAALTAEGWTFGGWYKEAECINAWDFANDTVTEAVTLYAKWEEIPKYTVVFDAQGHGTAPASQKVETGSKLTEPAALTAEGWTFGGWFKEAACTNAWDFANDTVTEAVTLYAKWKEIPKYTVVFDAQGHGTAPASQTVETGSKVTEPAALTAEGWNFGGWYKEAECINAWDFANDTVTGAATLFAKWTKQQNNSGSSGSSGSSYRSTGYTAVGSVGKTVIATFSPNWAMNSSGNWYITDSTGNIVADKWLCDDIITGNEKNVWYLLNPDGTMVTAGLVQDNTGNYYSIETLHNGYFGMLRYKNGFYDCNGEKVYLEFSQNHDGSFGAILNPEGLERLKAIYGITRYGIGNESIVYTKTF